MHPEIWSLRPHSEGSGTNVALRASGVRVQIYPGLHMKDCPLTRRPLTHYSVIKNRIISVDNFRSDLSGRMLIPGLRCSSFLCRTVTMSYSFILTSCCFLCFSLSLQWSCSVWHGVSFFSSGGHSYGASYSVLLQPLPWRYVRVVLVYLNLFLSYHICSFGNRQFGLWFVIRVILINVTIFSHLSKLTITQLTGFILYNVKLSIWCILQKQCPCLVLVSCILWDPRTPWDPRSDHSCSCCTASDLRKGETEQSSLLFIHILLHLLILPPPTLQGKQVSLCQNCIRSWALNDEWIHNIMTKAAGGFMY